MRFVVFKLIKKACFYVLVWGKVVRGAGFNMHGVNTSVFIAPNVGGVYEDAFSYPKVAIDISLGGKSDLLSRLQITIYALHKNIHTSVAINEIGLHEGDLRVVRR